MADSSSPKKQKSGTKSKATEPEAKSDGGVMAKLRAERAKKKKKPGARSVDRKGAEKPAEDAATSDREKQLLEASGGSKGKRNETHFQETAQRRIVGHAGARGRKAQSRRDQKG